MSISMIKNHKIRGILRAVTALALFATTIVLMSNSALAAGKSSLPDKNGFKDTTSLKKQDYTISIPSYYEPDIDEPDEYRAYANDGSFTMLIIDTLDDMGDYSFKDDKQRELFLNSIIVELDSNGKITESSFKKYGNLEGAYAVFTFSMEGIDFTGTIFTAIDGDYCYCFMLAEAADYNTYDYQPDFIKIIKSAKK